MIRNFCTYFDRHYLAKGLALWQSLLRHTDDFHLWVLCLDEETQAVLHQLALPHLTTIALRDLEDAEPGLRAVQGERSRVEYYFTCTPLLPLYILSRQPSLDLLTYLDADLFLFADPQPLFAELESASIGIFEHRFPPTLRHMLACGRYNVGWLSFRNDGNGLACLRWWRECCLDWCYDRLEEDRYGDQKYLDIWPVRFQGVHVFQHLGGNVAPWNFATYPLRTGGGTTTIGGQPLLFGHFHGVRRVRPWLYQTNLSRYGVLMSRALRAGIYLPYLRCLSQQYQMLDTLGTAADGEVTARCFPGAGEPALLHQAALGLANRLGLPMPVSWGDYFVSA